MKMIGSMASFQWYSGEIMLAQMVAQMALHLAVLFEWPEI